MMFKKVLSLLAIGAILGGTVFANNMLSQKEEYRQDYTTFTGNELISADWAIENFSGGGGGGTAENIYNSNGSLTGNRSIIGNSFNLDFQNINDFMVIADNALNIMGTTMVQILQGMAGPKIVLDGENTVIDGTHGELRFNGSGLEVAPNLGRHFQYANDNSANYGPRDIPDVAYVDGAISSNTGMTRQDTIDNQEAGGTYIYVDTESIEMEDDGAQFMIQSKPGKDFKFGAVNMLELFFNGGSEKASVFDSRTGTGKVGLEYFNGHTYAFGPDSIVPLSHITGYVDGAIASGVLADNGITKIGATLGLGGTLTKNNTLIAGTNKDFNVTLDGYGTNNINLRWAQGTSNQGLAINAAYAALYGGVGSSYGSIMLNKTSGLSITDQINTRGIDYSSDYSGNYTDRTLVDKGYVDAEIASEILAASGDYVHLVGDETIEGVKTFADNTVFNGNTFFNGTATYINSTNLDVEDKNIYLGVIAGATDITANDGGTLLSGDNYHGWLFDNANNSFDIQTDNLNIDAGQEYRIDDVSILASSVGNSTTLGATQNAISGFVNTAIAGISLDNIYNSDGAIADPVRLIDGANNSLAMYDFEMINMSANRIGLGFGNDAMGTGSIALGYQTTAMGAYSTTMGLNSATIATGAFSMGQEIRGNAENGFNVGQFNEGLSTSIFEIGVGVDDSNRENILTAYHSGLEVNGYAEYNSTTDMGTNDEAFASKDYVDTEIAGIPTDNIYTADGALAGDRVVNGGTNNLSFTNVGTVSFQNSRFNAISAAAVGLNSIAMGNTASSDGSDSIALGRGATSDGDNSAAIGRQVYSNGDYSLAMGYGTNADGDYSVAIGRGNDVNSVEGAALGSYLRTNALGSVSVGRYNLGLTDSVFEVGGGLSAGSRKNTLTAYNTGIVVDGEAKYTLTGDMGTDDEAFASKRYVDNNGGGGSTDTIYTADGTLTSDRTVDGLDARNMTFDRMYNFSVLGSTNNIIEGDLTRIVSLTNPSTKIDVNLEDITIDADDEVRLYGSGGVDIISNETITMTGDIVNVISDGYTKFGIADSLSTTLQISSGNIYMNATNNMLFGNPIGSYLSILPPSETIFLAASPSSTMVLSNAGMSYNNDMSVDGDVSIIGDLSVDGTDITMTGDNHIKMSSSKGISYYSNSGSAIMGDIGVCEDGGGGFYECVGGDLCVEGGVLSACTCGGGSVPEGEYCDTMQSTIGAEYGFMSASYSAVAGHADEVNFRGDDKVSFQSSGMIMEVIDGKVIMYANPFSTDRRAFDINASGNLDIQYLSGTTRETANTFTK